MKRIIKQLLPPVLLGMFRSIIYKKYGWRGNYKNWNEAKSKTTGYDNEIIFKKVANAALKVKRGEAIYERDSVIFTKIEYSWPLLAGLMYVSARKGGKLSVLDFGGSLGTTYFQNRRFFFGLNIEWSIIEQKHFVKFGNRDIADDKLKFYESIDSCLKERSPDVVVLSSVLQYIESPYTFLNELIEYGSEFLIFARTGFTLNNKDRLTVQKVPPTIYNAIYPCWFFSETKFLNTITKKYELMESFDSTDKANIPSVFKGFIFAIKENKNNE